jgi:D-glycero-beta-D-manno-heptose-7-phosphate kinase
MTDSNSFKDNNPPEKSDPGTDQGEDRLETESSSLLNEAIPLNPGELPFLRSRKAEIKEPDHEVKSKAESFKPVRSAKTQEEIEDNKRENQKEKTLTNLAENEPKEKLQEEEIAKQLRSENLYDQEELLEAIKAAQDLALGIDPEHTQGIQVFKELERVHQPDLDAATEARLLSKDSLSQCIRNLSGGKVIVLGDLLIDEYLEGSAVRISREAPVLILEHVDTKLIPGGAANTAHNVSALGGICHAIGVCGEDEYANKLAKLLESHNITHSLVKDSSRPTTVKTRIISKSHAFMQQLLRLDRISHSTINSTTESLLVTKLEAVADQYGALIISDYRAGAISDGIIAACKTLAQKQKIMIIVDSQDKFERFQDVTMITPNQPDAENAVGYDCSSTDKLNQAGYDLLLLTGAEAVLITRGAQGMALFRKGAKPFYLSPFNRSEIFDVTGAGDTVVATVTLALVTGAEFEQAIALGNLAAGIVVKKMGTAVTNQEEMLEHLERLVH